MNALTTFDYNKHNIRVIEIDGEPWFAAKDPCEALGMNLGAGTSQWLKCLSPDEKRRVTHKELPEFFSGSQAASMNFISESGLYKLIMRSDKPEAKAFQDWVTREVLPAIRKDGGYVMGEEKLKTGEMTRFPLIQHTYEALRL